MPAREHGMVLLPYYPLASGVLTGKYLQGQAVPTEYRLAAETPTGKRERNSLLSEERRGIVAALDSFARGAWTHARARLFVADLSTRRRICHRRSYPTRADRRQRGAANWELSADDFAAVVAITGPTSSRTVR